MQLKANASHMLREALSVAWLQVKHIIVDGPSVHLMECVPTARNSNARACNYSLASELWQRLEIFGEIRWRGRHFNFMLKPSMATNHNKGEEPT